MQEEEQHFFSGLHRRLAFIHKKLHGKNNADVISYQFDRTFFEQMIGFSLYIKWYRNHNFFLFSQKNFEKVLTNNQNVTLFMLVCIVSCNRNRFRLQSETRNSPQGARGKSVRNDSYLVENHYH